MSDQLSINNNEIPYYHKKITDKPLSEMTQEDKEQEYDILIKNKNMSREAYYEKIEIPDIEDFFEYNLNKAKSYKKRIYDVDNYEETHNELSLYEQFMMSKVERKINKNIFMLSHKKINKKSKLRCIMRLNTTIHDFVDSEIDDGNIREYIEDTKAVKIKMKKGNNNDINKLVNKMSKLNVENKEEVDTKNEAINRLADRIKKISIKKK